MMFLLRSAFWLSIVYAHMPWDGADALSAVSETRSAMIASVANAVADRCAENVTACRAIAGAVANAAPPAAASVTQRAVVKAKNLRPSANSLSAGDLTPAWRGPPVKS